MDTGMPLLRALNLSCHILAGIQTPYTQSRPVQSPTIIIEPRWHVCALFALQDETWRLAERKSLPVTDIS